MIEQESLFEAGKKNKETRDTFQLSNLGDWEDSSAFNKNGAVWRRRWWLGKGMALLTDTQNLR